MTAALFRTPTQDSGSARPRTPFSLDPLLTFAVVALLGCSLYAIATATEDDVAGQPLYYVVRQGIYGGVGLLLMLVVASFDYSRLRHLKVAVYGTMIGSILLVYAFATATRGSKRWIDLPFFRFQPSELGKVLLILALAAFLVDRARRLGDRETTSWFVLLALLPAVLVIAQPDLGSGLVYLAIAAGVLWIGGTKWTHLVSLAALGVAAVVVVLAVAPAAGVEVLKPYQVERLTAFTSPSDNPQDAGYQVNQSLTAVGAGRRIGRGPDLTTQTRLDFLPEHHTDFIFSVVGERFGFVGAAAVLSLFALLLWRAVIILTHAKNFFGTLVAGGIIAMLMFQIFVNVGMTLGIMPVTGVPLPLMSYGGSSLIVTFLALGLLQSIHAQARALPGAKGGRATATA